MPRTDGAAGWVSVFVPRPRRAVVMLVVADRAHCWVGAAAVPCCKTPADPALWHLSQCPRVNGVKAHTNKHNRRQVVLDLQIW